MIRYALPTVRQPPTRSATAAQPPRSLDLDGDTQAWIDTLSELTLAHQRDEDTPTIVLEHARAHEDPERNAVLVPADSSATLNLRQERVE